MIKYILLETGPDEYVPILFPALQKHSTMAMTGLTGIGRPVEAGFVSVGVDGKLTPYGESVSLNLKCTALSEEAFIALNSELY
jgi:hypothetical protein